MSDRRSSRSVIGSVPFTTTLATNSDTTNATTPAGSSADARAASQSTVVRRAVRTDPPARGSLSWVVIDHGSVDDEFLAAGARHPVTKTVRGVNIVTPPILPDEPAPPQT